MSLVLLSDDARAPIDYAKLAKYPRLGCSIASIVLKRSYPIRQIAQIYADCGVNFTTVNLLSAEWPSMAAIHVRPFLPAVDGQYDLYAWNQEHLDRIDECREEMNGRGIVVQWCFYELYSWSRRKAGPDTPNAKFGPWKQNINGVDWVDDFEKDHDDQMLAKILPDVWSKEYLTRTVPHLGLSHNLFLVGNEFPEKSLHERVRDYVRLRHPKANVSVNRNEDTPGQYANHKIGINFDFLNIHGRLCKQPSDLDREYPKTVSSVKTYRTLLKQASVDPRRICFSSDGARISDDPVNTYNYEKLGAFAKELFSYGANFEHQSRAKLNDWPNLHTIETDWLSDLAKALP